MLTGERPTNTANLDRFIRLWEEERARRLAAERDEFLTRRMMEFAWELALPAVDPRVRDAVDALLAATGVAVHNAVGRALAAAEALVAADSPEARATAEAALREALVSTRPTPPDIASLAPPRESPSGG